MGPAAPAAADVAPSSRRVTVASSTMTSGLSTSPQGVALACTPAFTPPAKPRFTGDAMSVTVGKSRATMAALPSSEALSTTTIGRPSGTAACRHDARCARAFQLTMTRVSGCDTDAAASVPRGARYNHLLHRG